jgi:hypothetical protein
MFQLRSEQIDAFAHAHSESFLLRLRAFMRAHFPDTQLVSDAELKVGLERVLRKAALYGLDGEQEQASFSVASWLLGEDFDKDHPQAQAFLSSDRLSSEEKGSWLDQYVRQVFQRLQGD